MTQQQKEHIAEYRASGASYGHIANVLGVSVNTVKSYCQRNSIQKAVCKSAIIICLEHCPQCNAVFEQTPGHRKKRFCSTACRMAWWRAHPNQLKRNVWHSAQCSFCGKSFSYYGNRQRKYCSTTCYQLHRIALGGDVHG